MFSNSSKLASGDTGDFTLPTPPTVDAGGPYDTAVGTNVQLNATVTQNSGSDLVITWTTDLPGYFDDPNIEDPIFTPQVVGSYVLTITVTTSNSAPIQDTATLEVSFVANSVRFTDDDSLTTTFNEDNTNLITISYWAYGDRGTTNDPSIASFIVGSQKGGWFSTADGSFQLWGNVRFVFRPGLHVYTGLYVFPQGQWNHIMMSVDLGNTSKRHFWVNDVDYSNIATWFIYNPSLELGNGTCTIGSLTEDVSELYVNFRSYIDLSVLSNREKFRKNKIPVYLGSDGSLPTGGQPLIYMTGGAATWNAGTNNGSLTGLTLAGNITTSTRGTPALP